MYEERIASTVLAKWQWYGQAKNRSAEMNKSMFLILTLPMLLLISCTTKEKDDRKKLLPNVELKAKNIPEKENVWVFILAGQSNMAGRGKVEPIDTIPDTRILSINKKGDTIIAKEPLHFYEPAMAGLDCGLSFGKELLKHIPDSISILLIPTAVGGSSINQWINDSTFRNVTLFSNFREKVEIGKKVGTIKGILWHQGESDAAKTETIDVYDEQLKKLFSLFRYEADNKKLPIFIGELGSFSKNYEAWQAINYKIKYYVKTDSSAYLIKTRDLNDIGDRVHFDSEGQRKMGKRFAEKFIEIQE